MPAFPNVLKAAIARGDIALGFGVSQVQSVALASLAKSAGYDWLAIDMEHGILSLSGAIQLCIAASTFGIAPVMRGTLGNLDALTRSLDNGAQGVLVARVETPAEARQIVEACRYAPVGQRSWGAGFSQTNAGPIAAAMTEAEANLAVLPMIESTRGVENALAIAAEPGVDGLFVGVLDLSIDLGVPGQHVHRLVTDAVQTAAQAARSAGKAFGFGGVSDQNWNRWAFALGARLVVGGSDQGFMLAAASDRARTLRTLAGDVLSSPQSATAVVPALPTAGAAFAQEEAHHRRS